MRNKILRRLCEDGALQSGGVVYCALSGGTDSVAMTHLLAEMAEELRISVRVCHFNHHLRGADSDEDEAFCRDFAERLGLPFTAGGADAADYARTHGQSIEEAARNCRYAFFETLDGMVATAHTADDQLETILINILRGTGLKGLGGIPPKRGRYLRPLWDVTREETEAYLKTHGLPHREDATNGDDDCLRNRLRHNVTPLLRAENPNWQENLSRMTELLRRDETLLRELSDTLLCKTPDGGWETAPMQNAERPLRERALRTILRECRIPKLTSAHILSVEKLLSGTEGTASVNLPEGWTAVRRYGALYLHRGAANGFAPASLPIPGEVFLPELGVTVYAEEEKTPGSVPIGASQIQGEVLVRPWRTGDALRLPGGRKELRRAFTDRKIPKDLRARIPVVACGDTVLAVSGLGGNRDCLPQTGERTLYISFREKREKG